MEKFSVFWLRLVMTHERKISFGMPIILWFVLRAILYGVGFGILTLAQEFVLEFFVIMFAFTVPQAITVFTLYNHLKVLVNGIGTEQKAPVRKMMRQFTVSELVTLGDLLTRMRGQEGVEVDRLHLLLWVRLCFLTFSEPYVGVDSSLPSEFRTRYGEYLDAHEMYLRLHPAARSVRILIRHPHEIDADRYSDPSSFNDFTEWHDKHRVALLVCPVDVARESAAKFKLPTTDVALWENAVAILFTRTEKKKEESYSLHRLRMTVVGEELFERVSNYIGDIKKVAQPLPELHMIPAQLIAHWYDFVGPQNRIKTSIPFLEEIIKGVAQNCQADPKMIRILDGAAGLGVEAAELFSRGYWVEINEIDEAFKRVCLNYITNQAGNPFPPERVHSVNWRDFRQNFGANSFHLIYILGNSLCLLRDAEDVQKVLRQLCETLFQGGALVVDERNFEYIWQEWGKSIVSQQPALTYRYKRKVIYCGTKVRGYPVRWESRNGVKRIVFEYDLSSEDGSWAKLAEISLYPFRNGELLNFLGVAGFKEIEKFPDMSLREDLNRSQRLPDADFFTYAAYK
jgi:hypothetical protein